MPSTAVSFATVLGLASQIMAFGVVDDSFDMSAGAGGGESTEQMETSVINGDRKGSSEAPWFAVMVAGSDGMQNMCGGAQVAEGWIMTAAHCTGFDSAHVEHAGDQWHIGADAVVSGQNWWESGWDGARMAPVTGSGFPNSNGWFVHPEYRWASPMHLGANDHDTKGQYDCGPALGDSGWSGAVGGFHDFGGDCEQWDMALVHVAPIDAYQATMTAANIIEIETNDVCSGQVTLWGTGRQSTNDKQQRVGVEKAVLNVFSPEQCFNSVWNLNFIGSGTGEECKEQADYFQNSGDRNGNLLCGDQAMRNDEWLGQVICAGGKSPIDGVVRSSCNGDSGGPITKSGKLVGMVNSGNVNDCENDEASLYFRLSINKAIIWVRNTITDNGGSITLAAGQNGLCTGATAEPAADTPAAMVDVPAYVAIVEQPAAVEASVDAVVETVEAEIEAEEAVEAAAGVCVIAMLKDSYGDGWNGGKIVCENGDHSVTQGGQSPATVCGVCTFWFTQSGQYPAEASVVCGGVTHQATLEGDTFLCGVEAVELVPGEPTVQPSPLVAAVQQASAQILIAEQAAELAAEAVGVAPIADASACGDATLKDSYGDGWNGGKMTCGGADFTLASGASSTVSVCGSCTFTFGAGQYPIEASVACGGETHTVAGGTFTCPGVNNVAAAAAADNSAALEAEAQAEEVAAAAAAFAVQAEAAAVTLAVAVAAQAAEDAAAAQAADDQDALDTATALADAANSTAVAAATAAAAAAEAAAAEAAAATTAALSVTGKCTATLNDIFGDGWNGGKITCAGTDYTLGGGSTVDVEVACGTCTFHFETTGGSTGAPHYPEEASVVCSTGSATPEGGDSFFCGDADTPAVISMVNAQASAALAATTATAAVEAAPSAIEAAGVTCSEDSVSPGSMSGGANYGNCGVYATKGWCTGTYYADEVWAGENCCSCQ